jgi:signal transduction histidine kinase
LLLSVVFFALAWEEQYCNADKQSNPVLKALITIAAEQPRGHASKWSSASSLPGMRERGLLKPLSAMYLPLPIAGKQFNRAHSFEISNAAKQISADRIFAFSVAEDKEGRHLSDAKNAASIYPFSSRQGALSGGRMSAIFPVADVATTEQPRMLKIAASYSGQGRAKGSRLLFYFSGVAFLLGLALLGAIFISIEKRKNDRRRAEDLRARRHISDTYLKRARAIARFGSYKIRISKESLQESNRWSEEMYRLLGREPAQGPIRIAAYIAHYVHPEDRSFVTSFVEKAVAGNSVAESEYRIIVPGGETRYVHDVLEYASSDGSSKVFLGQLHDITARHRMQDELDRTRDELRRSIATLESLRGKEQKRVAQEMHDDLGQLLAAMKIDLDGLRLAVSPCDIKVQQRLNGLDQLVGAMIVSVRRIVADLPPKELEDLDLFEALVLMKQNFQNRHRLPCHLKLPQEQPSLDRKIASAIYRTVQESLSNIAKHANATYVAVELEIDDDYITVRVTDNGKGMPPDAFQKTDSFGLIGMRERTTAFNGDMTLESPDHGGTVIQVRLPAGHA